MSTQPEFECKEWYCPATSNLPTRMPKRTWDALCRATQKQQNEAGWKGKVISGTGAMINYCSPCRGMRQPVGLEFITSAEMAELTSTEDRSMAGKGKSECEICSRNNASLGNNRGKLACPSCQGIIAAIAHRPESVAEAARICGKEGELMTLLGGESVAVDLESSTLKRIAAAVGYEGEDGEVLIKAVEVMAATTPDCATCAEGMSEQVTDLQREIQDLKDKLDHAAKYPSDDLLKAFEMTDNAAMDELELGAIQTAAMLEDAERTLMVDAERWRANVALLAQDFGQEKERAMGLEAYIDLAHQAAGIARDIPLDEWIRAMRDDNASMGERLCEIRAELGVGIPGDVVAAARGVVRQVRNGRELVDRLALAEAENERLNGLLDQQNNSLSLYVDPTREDLVAFALRVIRGEVIVAHCKGLA